MSIRKQLRQLVTERLEELGLTATELATRLQYVGTSPVTDVINENRRPRTVPISRIEDWVHALRLEGPQAEKLRELLHLLHASPELQAKWLQRQQILDELQNRKTLPSRRQPEQLAQELREVYAENERLRRINQSQRNLLDTIAQMIQRAEAG